MSDRMRRKCRKLRVASLYIGGDAPVVVQSMNASKAHDLEGNIAECHRLAAAGCELTRFSVPDREAAECLSAITERSPIPVVADIHFDYRMALAALKAGAAALRLNPGNLHSREGLREVARAARDAGIPIRVGVNAGSLDPVILREEGGLSAKALCRSALEAADLLDKCNFSDICLSLKASDPRLMIDAYRMVADQCDYPLHLGVTESGLGANGLIRSSVGIGTLLAEGIGDTIRVSLTADPIEEVRAAYSILAALKLRERGPVLISCPGCGRTEVDLRPLAARVQEYIRDREEVFTLAVMGCAVNGPGEAREADLGVAGGRGEFLLFRKGKGIRKIPEEHVFRELCREIDLLTEEIRSSREEKRE